MTETKPKTGNVALVLIGVVLLVWGAVALFSGVGRGVLVLLVGVALVAIGALVHSRP